MKSAPLPAPQPRPGSGPRLTGLGKGELGRGGREWEGWAGHTQNQAQLQMGWLLSDWAQLG